MAASLTQLIFLQAVFNQTVKQLTLLSCRAISESINIFYQESNFCGYTFATLEFELLFNLSHLN